MKLITLYVPEPYLAALDQLVDERYYPNRAEAIRVAIRDLLTVEVWERLPDEARLAQTEADSKVQLITKKVLAASKALEGLDQIEHPKTARMETTRKT